jgi:hypothetical protein
MIKHRKRSNDPGKRSIARWENEGGATNSGRGKGPHSASTLQRQTADRRHRRLAAGKS